MREEGNVLLFRKTSWIYVIDVIVLHQIIRIEHLKSIIIMENKKLPPKAIAALVFGILSILFNLWFIPTVAFVASDFMYSGSFAPTAVIICMWFVLVVLLAILGLNLSRKGYDAVNQNPELYRGVGVLKAARITSFIGIIIGFAALILMWVSMRK